MVKREEVVEEEEKEQVYPTYGKPLAEGKEQDLEDLAKVDRDYKNPMDEEKGESPVN